MGLEWWVGQGHVTQGLVGYCMKLKLSPQGTGEPLSREGEVRFVLYEDPSGHNGRGCGGLAQETRGGDLGGPRLKGELWERGGKVRSIEELGRLAGSLMSLSLGGAETYENPSCGTFI